MNSEDKTQFVAALVRRGWVPDGSTVWAPSKGIYFDDSHFQHWSLNDFVDIFARRAQRIADAKVGSDWEDAATENRQASEAADEVLKK